MRKYSRAKNWIVKPSDEFSYIQQAFVKAYADIEYCERQIQAAHFAGTDPSSYRDEPLQAAVSTIVTAIRARMCQAYQNLFMFGAVSNDPKVIKAAKAVAFERFLSDNSRHNEWLGHKSRYKGGRDYKGLTKDIHQLARKEGFRELQMSERSLHDDIWALKRKVEQLEKDKAKLREELRVLRVLEP